MTVKDIALAIESAAPLHYQESYDNSGLQVGDFNAVVTGVLVTLDITEAILEEAIQRGCNMIVAHHPIIFSGLKKLAGRNYVERIVQKAIKQDLNLYAAHTNLDNMRNGVNAKIAERLGLKDTSVLSLKRDTLLKLYTYVPEDAIDKVRDAMFAAGAGEIGLYTECSFNTPGTGTFRAQAGANPAIGTAGGARENVEEKKLEVLVPKYLENSVIQALKAAHPYEEVAYELVALQNTNPEIGAGLIGKLEKPMSEKDFLEMLKGNMLADCIRYTELRGKPVQTIAVCGGSGSFLLKEAMQAGADVFVTADFKYHQFFDAEGKIIIADIGHYETEQFTKELLTGLLKEKFPNFAVLLSNLSTNPIKYFC